MSDTIKDNKKNVLANKSQKLGSVEIFRNFFANDYHTFLVQKSERLASALYIITGFIAAEEPVRLKLRVCALDLISSSADSSRLFGSGVDQFTSRCAEIGTLLETALSAGFISHMNARLICDEYASLARFAKDNRTKIAESNGLSTAGLQAKFLLKSPLEGDAKLKDKNFSRTSRNGNALLKKRQSNRRDSILALFKDNDSISIKDAATSVIGYSEKTIQRELLSLVQEGLLTKEGERRWTTYRKTTPTP